MAITDKNTPKLPIIDSQNLYPKFGKSTIPDFSKFVNPVLPKSVNQNCQNLPSKNFQISSHFSSFSVGGRFSGIYEIHFYKNTFQADRKNKVEKELRFLF